jgi:hypothetical protein
MAFGTWPFGQRTNGEYNLSSFRFIPRSLASSRDIPPSTAEAGLRKVHTSVSL